MLKTKLLELATNWTENRFERTIKMYKNTVANKTNYRTTALQNIEIVNSTDKYKLLQRDTINSTNLSIGASLNLGSVVRTKWHI